MAKRGGPGHIRQLSGDFREELRKAVASGRYTPSTWLLARLQDVALDPETKEKLVADADTKDRIAMALVQYELPRLASIEAETTSVTKTHEEWLRELDDGEPEQRSVN